MSIYTEISRLIAARGRIRDKLTALGLATAQDKLDILAGVLDGVADCGAVEKNLREGETYQIPAGYHNGAGCVVGVSGGGSYDLQQKQVTPDLQAQRVTPDAGYYGLSAVTVAAIPASYGDVSGVTAGADDVRAGKVIVSAAGQQTVGTMMSIRRDHDIGIVKRRRNSITLRISDTHIHRMLFHTIHDSLHLRSIH